MEFSHNSQQLRIPIQMDVIIEVGVLVPKLGMARDIIVLDSGRFPELSRRRAIKIITVDPNPNSIRRLASLLFIRNFNS